MNIRSFALGRSAIVSAAALCSLFAIGGASAQPTPGTTGACCVRAPDGSINCRVATAADCRRAGGLFRGAGTACERGTCAPPPPPPPPTGACCTAGDDGTANCAVVTPRQCAASNGRYRGDNTACDPNPCAQRPAVTGACCLRARDGSVSCVVVLARRCAAAGGRFLGADTACEADSCRPPTPPARGACCLPATDTAPARCIIAPAARCDGAGGTYAGDNVSCASAACEGIGNCPCDWDRNGLLGPNDLYTFTEAFMNGDADFNGDGTTDRADLMAFMDCFRSVPDGCVRGRR